MTLSCPVAARCRFAACQVPAVATLAGVLKVHPRAHRPGDPCALYEASAAAVDDDQAGGDDDQAMGVAGGQGRSAGDVVGCAEAMAWLAVVALLVAGLAAALASGCAGGLRHG